MTDETPSPAETPAPTPPLKPQRTTNGKAGEAHPPSANDRHNTIIEALKRGETTLPDGTPIDPERIEAFKRGGTARRGKFLQSANDVKAQNIRWVWKYRLARGAMHLIAGQPGTAKSTIAFNIAAALSYGGKLPDGTPAPVGKVAIWSGEDDYNYTIKPRLAAQGANFNNILFIGRGDDGQPVQFNPSEHMGQLAEELKQHPDVLMVIIDPIVSATKGDSHKNAEVRTSLQPLIDLLQDTGAVGLGITHFTKGTTGRHVVERVTGSLAFGAVARVVFATAQEKDNPNKYRMVIAKNNIGPTGGGFEYAIRAGNVRIDGQDIEATRIEWGVVLAGDATGLIADAEGTSRLGRPSKQKRAEALLRDLLANGPVLVDDVKKAGEKADISYDTLAQVGKAVLGVVVTKVEPGNPRSKRQWEMPKEG